MVNPVFDVAKLPMHPQGTQCPASGVTCKRCNRKGHFASQCFSTTVWLPTNELTLEPEVDAIADEVTIDTGSGNELSLDTAFPDAVTSRNQATSWTSDILIGNTESKFKLDTGAEATAITEDTYKLLPNIVLQKPRKILQGPAKQCLDVLGQFQATLCYKQTASTQTLYVTYGLHVQYLHHKPLHPFYTGDRKIQLQGGLASRSLSKISYAFQRLGHLR